MDQRNVRELCKLELDREMEQIYIRRGDKDIEWKMAILKQLTPQEKRGWLAYETSTFYDGEQPGGMVGGIKKYRGVVYSGRYF